MPFPAQRSTSPWRPEDPPAPVLTGPIRASFPWDNSQDQVSNKPGQLHPPGHAETHPNSWSWAGLVRSAVMFSLHVTLRVPRCTRRRVPRWTPLPCDLPMARRRPTVFRSRRGRWGPLSAISLSVAMPRGHCGGTHDVGAATATARGSATLDLPPLVRHRLGAFGGILISRRRRLTGGCSIPPTSPRPRRLRRCSPGSNCHHRTVRLRTAPDRNRLDTNWWRC